MREPAAILQPEELQKAKQILLKYRKTAIDRKNEAARKEVEHVIWVMSELYRRAMGRENERTGDVRQD